MTHRNPMNMRSDMNRTANAARPLKTTSDEAVRLLIALQDLSRANLASDLGVLAGRLGWGVGRVVRVLAHLERKGVADRASCRLTLAGLAMATAIEAAAIEQAVAPVARASSAA